MTDSQSACPRCKSDETTLQFQGNEEGEVLWSLYTCDTCCFAWRTTESDHVIDPEKRPHVFQLDPERLDEIEVIMPPGETK